MLTHTNQFLLNNLFSKFKLVSGVKWLKNVHSDAMQYVLNKKKKKHKL